jgi:hypothetical protein
MTNTIRIVERVASTALLFVLLLSGCAPTQPTSDYGASEGATSRSSPDGFSIVRQLCVEAGYATTSVRSLPSNGERKFSSLIWAPHGFRSHNSDTMDWVERWLKTGNKTLVYVGADYSPLVDYWEVASRLNHAEGKSEDAATSAAFEKSDLLNRLASGYQVIAFPWGLYRKKLGEQQTIVKPEGEWGSEVLESDINLKQRSYFQVWSDVSDSEIDHLLQTQGTSANPSTSPGSASSPPSSQPNAPPGFPLSWLKPESWGEEYVLLEKARRDAIKANNQNASAEATSDSDFWNIFGDRLSEEVDTSHSIVEDESEETDNPTHEAVLSGPDRSPVISIISKPSWNGSRIVLLSNASLVSNLSLTYGGNRMIANRLIGTFAPGRVGFLSQSGDPIVLDGDSGSSGLTSLLTKPVNLLAAHLVFLGLVALLYLWPIFGRPAELPTPSTQSFSLHINALGGLLKKTGDDFYARTTIADYFRQVKKDHNSMWANLDAEYAPTAESPFKKDDVNSATKNATV